MFAFVSSSGGRCLSGHKGSDVYADYVMGFSSGAVYSGGSALCRHSLSERTVDRSHALPLSPLEYDHFKVFVCGVATRFQLASGMQI